MAIDAATWGADVGGADAGFLLALAAGAFGALDSAVFFFAMSISCSEVGGSGAAATAAPNR